MKRLLHSILALVLFAGSLFCIEAQLASETKAQRETRMAWWKEARFGLFIHWGLYAIPAGEWEQNKAPHPFLGTEWLMAYRQIPVTKYKELAAQFNPTKFDAEAWVLAAKKAGMKYIVFTAKHHDGFAMFDSKVSDFNVVQATPFKRDIVKELAEACQRHGIKLGLYYSQAQDWTNKGGTVATFMKRWDDSQNGSFAEYVDQIAVPQVKEILGQYGPISVIWWDTPQDMTPAIDIKFQEALSTQPNIIQNSRLIGSNPGDFRVFEGDVPLSGVPGTPWEACVMMNDSWGYSRVHHEWSSAPRFIRQLIQSASLNGNYLLNVGPDASGVFPPEAVALLGKIGEWTKINGEAIYGSTGFPTKKIWQQGRLTQKPGRLFASIFLWPSNGKLTIPIQASVKKVCLLSQPEKPLPFTVGEAGVIVEVHAAMPDASATVLIMEIEGKATEAAQFPALCADANGLLDLLPPYATFSGVEGAKPKVLMSKREGGTLPLTNDPAEAYKIGGFTSVNENAHWRIQVNEPGKYSVVAYMGVHKSVKTEVKLIIQSADQTLEKIMQITGEGQTFKPTELGKFSFASAGEYEVTAAVDLAGAATAGCNLWRIQLQRIAK